MARVADGDEDHNRSIRDGEEVLSHHHNLPSWGRDPRKDAYLAFPCIRHHLCDWDPSREESGVSYLFSPYNK